MLRFFQKIEGSTSHNTDYEQPCDKEVIFGDDDQQTPRSKYMKVDINALPADPGERPSMETYHPNQRDEIRRAYLQKGPCQPKNHTFRQRDIGGRLRRFIPAWFNEFKYWLEYSMKMEAAFCLCCYLFKSDIKNQGGSDTFVLTGYTNWNKKEGFNSHSAGKPHNMAVQMCQNLMNQKQSITTAFDKQSKLMKNGYRIRLNASVDCVRFLLRQGLPFRGHNEKDDSSNKGNFLELLQWLVDRCEMVYRFALKKAPKNSQMKCGIIQKEIVHACVKETIKVILKELGDDLFAILVDESRDVSCKEQMALILCFVNSEGVVVERFIGIKHVNNTSALSLKETICAMLADCGLSLDRIRGQGYDGASNMSGEFNGLKTLIMNENKSAYFVHCFAHQLQLALVFVAKNHHDIHDFFDLISRLINMIGSSYKRRDNLRDKQAKRIEQGVATDELPSGKGKNQEIGIKRPCDTRWGSHYGSLLNILNIYFSICEVLVDVMNDSNCQDHRAEARRLLKSLKTFDFVFCLHLMVEILGVTNELNMALQKKDQDIVNAMHQVRVSKVRLQHIRNVGWESLLSEVISFCNEYDTEVLDMDGPYFNGISRRKGSHVTYFHHYKIDLFYSVIDMQLQELNNRFDEVSRQLLLFMTSLSPSKCFESFEVDELMKMAEFYPLEFPKCDQRALKSQLVNYIMDVRQDARFDNLKSIGDLSKMMVNTRKHEIFPKVYLLVKLALILPVATSTVERAFSTMKLIKTDLRNRIGDDFMNDCLVSYIEKDVLDGVSNDTIIDFFHGMHFRREQL